MQTSAAGVAFLERHEGVVLRAYRCPAGVWTIGAGLTAASGVVRPKAGMTVTAAAATQLLGEALRRNYEPAVAAGMRHIPDSRQHEFDAGVSFHFNTGAIGRASWVRHWRAGDWRAVAAALGQWRRGGGRVLPGLVRRREEELALLRNGDYGRGPPARPPPPPPGEAPARLAAPVTAAEVPAIRAALKRLGYAVGQGAGAIPAEAVRRFQRDHGLADDGIVGRATAATLQRVLDGRAGAAGGTAAAAGGGAAAGGAEAAPGLDDLFGGLPVGEAVALAALLWLAWRAFTHRDALAGAVNAFSPRLAAFLRSF